MYDVYPKEIKKFMCLIMVNRKCIWIDLYIRSYKNLITMIL